LTFGNICAILSAVLRRPEKPPSRSASDRSAASLAAFLFGVAPLGSAFWDAALLEEAEGPNGGRASRPDPAAGKFGGTSIEAV